MACGASRSARLGWPSGSLCCWSFGVLGSRRETMMRTPCPRILDERVHKWGFELEDLYLLGACSCVLLVALALVPLPGFDSPFVWAGLTVVVFAVAYYGKRGKPP